MYFDLIQEMASNGKISNLSIIAVRILPHCRDYVRKCLKENILYYLNSNFEILDNGDTIKIRNGYVESLDDSFFDLEENYHTETNKDTDEKEPRVNISISAIVGKNGDGKSSLAELIIRILNNFACRKDLNPNGHLRYVDGVYGELYYRLNGKFFRIRIGNESKENDEVEFHAYAYDEAEKVYRIGDSMTKFDPDETTFYTLVSNYSHFAYNTEEFSEETASDNEDDHWLHQLFHKNDAYQTPINLHPYRYKGNIDINRERSLSIQRLLISIAGSFKKSLQGRYETSVVINEKIPYELRLRDIGESKLQEITLRKYLSDNRNVNIIQGEIKRLKDSMILSDTEQDIDPIVGDYTGKSLSYLSKYYLTSKFMRFADRAIKWMESSDLINDESDIKQLLDLINRLNDDIPVQDGYVDNEYLRNRYLPAEHMIKWRKLEKLSALQFLRLSLVFDICQMWNKMGSEVVKNSENFTINPYVVFKKYDEMSNTDKICHYIIYKTIEIFNTYPSYKDPLKDYSSPQLFFIFRGLDYYYKTLINLIPAFNQLSDDWSQKSHSTLKLRQSYRYMIGKETSRPIYDSEDKDGGRSIIFGNIGEKQIKILSDIETLPPPIFKWEIWFKKQNDDRLIPLFSFSSGEKQKLFFQSAILYHLQNISSIGAENIHYHAVNLIFEEIELYFHPEWQRKLIFDLMKAIRSANIPNINSVNMIFVTHSPYVLSDIPKSNVLFLKDGAPTFDMHENTFGANINSLLKNGFFLPSLPMGEFAYRKINKLFEMLHSGSFNPKEIDQLYAQIMTVGEPAIRMQLMTLYSAFKRLIIKNEEIIEELFNIRKSHKDNASD